MHIYQDSRDSIYLCTVNGGINKLISSNLLSDSISFKSYTVRDGLASDIALSMIEDRKKNLWIVSENALSRFNPDLDRFENFSHSLFHKSYIFTEALPEKRGQDFVFGTESGMVMINPMEMKKDTQEIFFSEITLQKAYKRMISGIFSGEDGIFNFYFGTSGKIWEDFLSHTKTFSSL